MIDPVRPTTLITGATRGIGREAATQLSEHGHALVIAARDTETAQDLARGLPGPADVYEVDLASLASVREFAAQVRARRETLAVLINNAGVMKRRREITNEGFERTWVVNHLAPPAAAELSRVGLPARRAAVGARRVAPRCPRGW
jgi:NAD(P)-dependent dehydrogenase (short-subunit alcohol dehydrogenase family)